ncbi:MAG TPA: recombinase family protein [Mycobacteriales bacterium]
MTYTGPTRPSTRWATWPAAVRLAYDILLAGGTPASIARTWNASGLPTVEGEPPRPTGPAGAWDADAVRSVLTGPWYAGPLARTPVISPDEWRAAMEILGDAARPASTEVASALLTATARCGRCDRPVRSRLEPAGQLTYRCDGHLVRTAAPVDSWLRLLVIDRLGHAELSELVANEDRPDLYALDAQSAGLRTRHTRMREAAADGTVDRSVAASRTDRLEAELAAVDRHKVDHVRLDVPASVTGADPVDSAWDQLSVSRQRGVLLALARRVTLHPVPAGRRAGDPDVLRATVVVDWRDATARTRADGETEPRQGRSAAV